MKILILTPYFHPHIGGSERYLEELHANLMKQNSDVSVDVLTYNSEKIKNEEKYKGFHIYRVNSWEILPNQFVLPNYIDLFNLLNSLKKNNYTHVVANTRFFDTAWWGFLVAKYFGAKSILIDHCASHPNHQNAIIRLVAKLIDFVLMPFLSKAYHQIFVVSKATKDFWIKSVGSSNKIKVVQNSVDEFQSLTKNKKSSKLSVRFFGRNVVTKGANVFEAVATELKFNYPNVIFERVEGISHKKVMNLLANTSILVHPSSHHEGLPTLILEAGLAGAAVVASDAGGTKEIIKNNVSGLLVKPSVIDVKHGIEKLLNNQLKAEQMASNLRQKVLANYTWSKTARVYEKLLSS